VTFLVFESSCHLLLPVCLTTSEFAGLSSLNLFNAEVNQGSCEYQLFKYFDLTRRGIEPRFTNYKAGALNKNPARNVSDADLVLRFD